MMPYQLSRLIKMYLMYISFGVSVSIVLGFTKNPDLKKAGEILENNATSFLGTKGPRIDYKLKSIDSKVYLDPLMTSERL